MTPSLRREKSSTGHYGVDFCLEWSENGQKGEGVPTAQLLVPVQTDSDIDGLWLE